MADVPQGLILKRDRDLEGRGWHIWLQRALLGLLLAIVVTALVNEFGQRADTTSVTGSDARLVLHAPTRVRPGLLFEARFRIEARTELKRAVLVLDPGWAEGFTINTIEPSPIGEGSGDDGRLVFTLGHVSAGQSYTLFMQFQVNPTNIGGHDQDVELLDGSRRIAELHRTITVFP